MSGTFLQPGDILDLTSPTGGVVAGVAVLVGGLVVIPTATVAQTLPFEGRVTGVHTCAKTAGATWSEGQTLYFDSAAGSFATAQSATARRAAIAVAAAASGDTTGKLKLNNIGAPVNVV